MLERSLHCLLAASILLGPTVGAKHFFDCAMSGKRSEAACCCSAAGTKHQDASHALRASEAARAEIRSSCCRVTRETARATAAQRPATDGTWKQTLDDARHLPVASAVVPAQVPTIQPVRSSVPIHLAHAAPDEPLFILHRSLLI